MFTNNLIVVPSQSIISVYEMKFSTLIFLSNTICSKNGKSFAGKTFEDFIKTINYSINYILTLNLHKNISKSIEHCFDQLHQILGLKYKQPYL